MCVCVCEYVCVCLCTVSEAGLIAGASSSHGPSGNSEAAEVAVLEGPSRPIGGAGQGITAEVFPAPARPISPWGCLVGPTQTTRLLPAS